MYFQLINETVSNNNEEVKAVMAEASSLVLGRKVEQLLYVSSNQVAALGHLRNGDFFEVPLYVKDADALFVSARRTVQYAAKVRKEVINAARAKKAARRAKLAAIGAEKFAASVAKAALKAAKKAARAAADAERKVMRAAGSMADAAEAAKKAAVVQVKEAAYMAAEIARKEAAAAKEAAVDVFEDARDKLLCLSSYADAIGAFTRRKLKFCSGAANAAAEFMAQSGASVSSIAEVNA